MDKTDDAKFIDEAVTEYKKEYLKSESDDAYSKMLILAAEVAARTYLICEKVKRESQH